VADPPGYAQGDSDYLLKCRDLWRFFFYEIAQYDMAVEKLQVKAVPVAARRLSIFYIPLALTSTRGRKRGTGVSEGDGSRAATRSVQGNSWRRESSSMESADSLDGALMSTEASAPSEGPFEVRMLDNQQCRMFEAGFHWIYHITANSVNDEHALKIAVADDDHSVANSGLKDPLLSKRVFATRPLSDDDCWTAAGNVYDVIDGSADSGLTQSSAAKFTARLCSKYREEIFGDY
ncbi:hypothetical protein FOZ63_027902, partial [Perkinsus olseni]